MKKKLVAFYKKHKKKISLILRIVVSIGLITYLVLTQFKDLRGAIDTLKSASIYLLLLSLSTHVFGIWITAVRWNTLLRTQGIRLSMGYITSSVLIGFFFNNFLPTSIGGDVFRTYDISRKAKIPMGTSASIIIVERFTGIVSAATYAIIALVLGFTAIGGQSIIIPIIIFFVLSLIIGAMILNPRLFGAKKIGRFMDKYSFLKKIKNKLKNVIDTFQSFRKFKWALTKAFIYSFLLQFAVILNYYLASKALGIELGLTAFIFIVPIVALIAMLPISIGGIGLRENSLVFIMTALGAARSPSALTSLILFAMLILIGIIGGLVYVIRPYVLKDSTTKRNMASIRDADKNDKDTGEKDTNEDA